MVEENQDSQQKPKRKRGLFPSLPLRQTLELPEAIFELGQGESPVRRVYVFDRLDRAPESGTSNNLVAAARTGYGLIHTDGDFFNLTERGKAIFEDNKHRRQEAIYDALFSNDIFANFMSSYGSRPLREDRVMVDIISRDFGLEQKNAKTCWNVFKSNIFDYGLVKTLSGGPTILPRDEALKEYADESVIEDDDETIENLTSDDIPESNINSEDVRRKQLALAKDEQIATQFHFNIQIHIPENATAEAYNNIFKSIADHLLGRNRNDE